MNEFSIESIVAQSKFQKMKNAIFAVCRKKNKWLPKIKEFVDKNDPGAMIIPFSGKFQELYDYHLFQVSLDQVNLDQYHPLFRSVSRAL